MINKIKLAAIQAIEAGVCVAPPVGCGKAVTAFRDELSDREYHITGMCQECQDKFYAVAKQWENDDDSDDGYEPPF